jgi:putative SOS response-associated peptidase YedK
MCGRFTQNYTWTEVHAFLSLLGTARNLRPHYNIAYDKRRRGASRSGGPPRVGVDALGPGAVFLEENAQGRTGDCALKRSPTSRCFARRSSGAAAIPASGFFEWTDEKGDKQPHLFTAADGSPILAFAGLWDKWRDPATGRRVAVLHHHRVGSLSMDDSLSRSHAGAACGEGFRRLARRHARRGCAQAGGRERAARMAGIEAHEPHGGR